MTRRDDRVRLREMLEYSSEAIAFAHGRSREDLDTDRLFGLAMTRLVEIIGEAATKVSGPTRKKYPEIPWLEIIATRNRLIHGYTQIDNDVVWDILCIDLPLLVTQLRKAVADAAAD